MSSKDQKQRPRLGRGLSSLISVSTHEPVELAAPIGEPVGHAGSGNVSSSPIASLHTGESDRLATVVLDLPVTQISPNPHQPRRQFDEALLGELAASLKSTGLIQPVVVRLVGDRYELIAGERRWRAARLAGLTTLPAIVRQADSTTQAQMALVENIQRQDLNAIDRAEAYQSLITKLGLTQAELAQRLGEDRSSIANHLRLLELSPAVSELVRLNQITLGHAKLLAGLTDHAEQTRLAGLVQSQGLSVRNLERVLAEVSTGATKHAPVVSAHLQDLEKSLARQLGMRVQVRSTAQKGKGRLVIYYSSLDQFDDLLGRLGVKADE